MIKVYCFKVINLEKTCYSVRDNNTASTALPLSHLSYTSSPSPRPKYLFPLKYIQKTFIFHFRWPHLCQQLSFTMALSSQLLFLLSFVISPSPHLTHLSPRKSFMLQPEGSLCYLQLYSARVEAKHMTNLWKCLATGTKQTWPLNAMLYTAQDPEPEKRY